VADHELVIPSPRETPAHRLRKVRTACPRSIADSWNKPEFTAAADMWSSGSLRGRVNGVDHKKDEYSFYAAMKDYKNGRLEKAIKKWESIRLQLMMKGGEPSNVAKPMAIVCGYLGDAYHRLVGEYPKAVDFHISSLNFGEEVRYQCGKDCAVSESHEDAIAALPAIGQPQKPVSGTSKRTAIEYHTQQLDYARNCNDKVGEQDAARGLGHSHRWFDSHTDTIEHAKSKLFQARKFGEYQLECKCLEIIGQTLMTEGQWKDALMYLHQELKSAKSHGDWPIQARSHLSLGCANRGLGKLQKAIDHHESAVAFMTQECNREGLGKAYLELSMDYHAYLPRKYTFGIGKVGKKELVD